MAITTNNSTYHDDYNTLDSNSPALTPNDKNYLRILFKPGYSVQVRELNQMQSMLQSQIDKFGRSTWNDNVAVTGGETTFSKDIQYVEASYSGVAANLTSTTWLSYTPSTTTNIIYADVLKYELVLGTTYRFYIRYRTSAVSGTGTGSTNISDFAGATTLSTNNSLTGITLSATGYACGIYMAAGVFFTKGSFVASPAQNYFFTLTSKDQTVVGNAVLTVVEKYVNSYADITLFDNAAGTPNASAPGADRYAIDLELGFDYDDVVTEDSVAKIVLKNIVNSIPTASVDERTASFDTKLAVRTFEESGNYVLDPFKINVRELYNDGSNIGRFTTSELDKAGYGTSLLPGGSSLDFVADAKARYSLEVDKSTAYVEGHRIVLNDKYDISASKARDTSPTALLSNATAAIGNYVLGTFDASSQLPNTTDITKRFNLNVLSVTKQATVTAGSVSIYILSGTAGLVVGMPVTVNSNSCTIASINASANTITVTGVTGSGGAVTTPILTFGSLATAPATCKIKTVELEGGTTYRIYLYDIQMAAGATANISQLNRLYLAADTFNFSITKALSETTSDTAIFPLPYTAVKTVTGVKYILRHVASGTTSSGLTLLPLVIPSGGAIVDGSPGNVILNINGSFVTPSGTTTTSGIPVSSQGGAYAWSAVIPVLMDGADDNGETAITKTLVIASQSFTTTAISSTVYATAIIAGNRYQILVPGTTDFTAFGSINSTAGTVFIATTSGTGSSGSGTVTQGVTEFTLSQADVFKLTAVTLTKSGGSAINILADCTISDDGQRSNYYTNVKVKYNGTRVFISTDTIAFTYSYLDRNGANINGFTTVDSYNSSTNIAGGLTYDTIPSFNGKRLSDVIDFRPIILSGTSATSTKQQIDPGSALLSKSVIYLPRIDRLVVGSDASFKIEKGTPAIPPTEPKPSANSMALYTLEIPAYTYNTSDIKINYIDNRRYTMRDIGALETRITSLETYTELSKLETVAQNKVITDILGTRFKNAVLTDGFANHNIGDNFNASYNCSIDPDEGIARPSFSTRRVDFKRVVGSETGITIGANIATLNYTEAELINQPYASSYESVNPYEVTTYNGNIELSPSSDEWKDVTTTALSKIIVNTGSYDNAVKNTILGTVWNNWTTTWTGKKVVTWSKQHSVFNPARGFRMQQIVTTTPSIQKRTGTNTTLTYTDIVERKEDRIIDVSFIPFMRSRKVYFRAKRLKPKTRVYPFFDGIDISSYATSTPFVSFKDTTLVRDYKGAIAGALDFTPSELVTNEYGEIEGLFLVPNNDSLKFKVGSRIFKLTDSPRNIEADATTFVQGDYSAIGISETHETDIITTRVPQVKTINLSESRNVSDVKITWDDPLAQSFMLSNISTGAYLTSVDLYFQAISSTSPVTIHIVTMENGYPTQKIVPFSAVTKNPYAPAGNTGSTQLISTSEDSTVATNFKFSDPVYLKANTEYALVIMSNDPNYKVWVADNNGFDVSSNPKKPINKNVYAGVFFKSQNGSTWSADQTRDLKFKINRAVFSPSGSLSFKPVLDDGVSMITVNAQTASVNTGFTSTATVTLPMPYAASAGTNPNIDETTAYKRATATLTVDPSTGAVVAVNITGRGKGYGINDTATWFNANTVWKSDGSSSNPSMCVSSVYQFVVNLDSATLTSFNITQSNLNIPSTTIDNVLTLGTGVSAIVSPVEAYENYDLNSVYAITSASAANTTLTTSVTTTSDYVSPVIDLDRVSLLAIKNEVNNSVVGETIFDAGAATSRYLTKLIKLDKPANQLNVYMDVNRPSTDANIAVYIKLVYDGNANIPTAWALVNPTNLITVSSSDNDFSESEYVINSSANDFLAFALKIVFLSGNTYDVASVANLKAIATTGL